MLGLSLALLAGVALCGVLFGSVRLPAGTLPAAVRHLLNPAETPAAHPVYILLHLRLPRVLAALLVGAALALSGAAMQGLFRNPMASPDILGVSAGASLGAVLAVSLPAAAGGLFGMTAATIAGALLAAGLIYLLASGSGKTHLLFIILAGLAVSSFFNGLVTARLLFAREYEVSRFIHWTMGGLEGQRWIALAWKTPLLLVCMGALLVFARDLNLLVFGEDHAHSLGVSVEHTKRIVLTLAALLTGLAVSISGPVAFIGLLVPHLMRFITGPDHRRLLPAAALGGAIFLAAADVLGRVLLAPFEIKVGIITALLGSPYFLVLIYRYRKGGRHVLFS